MTPDAALPPDSLPRDGGDTLGRRDRERLVRRRAMLDAALGVFGDKGFDGATVDEIAERAEFGKGTLYNYFPGGKDELYLTLFEDVVVGNLHRVLDATLATASFATAADVRAAYCDFVEGLFVNFEAHRPQHMLFMRDGERMMLDPDKAAFFGDLFDRFVERVAAPLDAAIAAGLVRPLPARSVAHLLMGTVRGYLIAADETRCLPKGRPQPSPFATPGEAASFITSVFFDGLLAQPAAPADPA